MSRYDIEDDLNRYGSPVYKARESTVAPVVSEPTVLFSARGRASGVTIKGSDRAHLGAPKLERGPVLQIRTESLM